jgi:protein O-GlcNAc transferase
MPSPNTSTELGRIQSLLGRGQFDAALSLCQQWIELARDDAEAWFWLGYVQLLRGDLHSAETALTRAVGLDAQQSLYWTNLAIVALGLGRPADAESLARQAIALDDASDAVWVNLGSALFHQHRYGDAVDAYRQAVKRQPQNAAAWANLASAALQQGDLAAAQEAYEHNLTIAPTPEMATKYAALLVRRDQPQLAAHILQQVVEQAPDQAAAAGLELGDALALVGYADGAEATYRQALAADPKCTSAHRGLAFLLLSQFRCTEAEDCLRKLIDTDARDADAWALLSSIKLFQAQPEEALDACRRSVALAPDPARHSRLLASLQYVEGITPEALLAEHRAWEAAYAGSPAPASRAASRPRDAGRPLRVGFYSGNFCRHPIAFLMLPAVKRLDKSQCTVVCYSDRPDEDEYTPRFRAAADIWRATGRLTDDQLMRQIEDDEIDVLIDLMGHTGQRLLAFSRKPARVQITWLGYVGTTGLTAMDFLLADRFHVRPDEESAYSEAVLRMPHSYACYGPPDYMPEVNSLPAAATGRVTFGSFNNPAKLTPRLLDAWAAILDRVAGSQLLLKFGGLDEPQTQAPIRERLAKLGIRPERILMEGRSPHADFLAAYSRVDLALDTQPYSGGVTTCEALWMGVPVVTLPGRTFAGRHSTSYLQTAGLPEFIAADWPGYIDRAVRWAGRLDELAALRGTLREQLRTSPLCDAPRFAADFLVLLEHACQRRIGAPK